MGWEQALGEKVPQFTRYTSLNFPSSFSTVSETVGFFYIINQPKSHQHKMKTFISYSYVYWLAQAGLLQITNLLISWGSSLQSAGCRRLFCSILLILGSPQEKQKLIRIYSSHTVKSVRRQVQPLRHISKICLCFIH